MEEVNLKKSRIPNLKDVINYRDFFVKKIQENEFVGISFEKVCEGN